MPLLRILGGLAGFPVRSTRSFPLLFGFLVWVTPNLNLPTIGGNKIYPCIFLPPAWCGNGNACTPTLCRCSACALSPLLLFWSLLIVDAVGLPTDGALYIGVVEWSTNGALGIGVVEWTTGGALVIGTVEWTTCGVLEQPPNYKNKWTTQ